MKVAIAKIKGAPSIVVYPNPITNNRISVRFNNIGKGIYILKLFNSAQQLTAIKTIQHSGIASLESFEIKEKLATGKYDLQLAGEGIVLTTAVIKR